MPLRLERCEPGRLSDARPYAVLDVETDGLRGELTYWTATCECPGATITTGRDAESLWRHVLAHDGREHASRDHLWWSHAGGEYDYVYFLPSAVADALDGRARITPVVRSDQMIGLRVSASKHRTDLRDSYALLPSSLADLAAHFAPDLPKLDIGLHDGVVFDPEREDHRAYAARDVESLLAVMVRFRALLAETFDVLPSWSAASTALRAWQRMLGPDERYHRPHPSASALARDGYFGGLVHLSTTIPQGECLTLDVNSMYPAAMRDAGVPDGWTTPVGRYVPGAPGFYHVDVRVPVDEPFTFLPYRDPIGRLAWPTGRFRTTITSMEYAEAVRRGYRIDVVGGVVWSRLAYPFAAYVERIAKLRALGGPMSYTGKLMGNGLYGKFGAKPLRDEWIIAAERPGPDWWPPAGAGDDPRLEGLWQRPDAPLRAAYLMPHWSAWITAAARLRLCALVDAIGARHVLYTDTDSVTAPAAIVRAAIDAGRVRIGPAFGDCKVEHDYTEFRAIAPKVTFGVERSGAPVYRAKGIPRDLRAAAFAGETVGWTGANAALQVLRGAAMTTDRRRTLSDIDNSVAWRHLPDGTVRPVHFGGLTGDAAESV